MEHKYKESIIEAVWQMWYHNELSNLEDIDGNDHKKIETIANNLILRLGHEGLIIKEE